MRQRAAYTFALPHRPAGRLNLMGGLTSWFGVGLPTTHRSFLEPHP